MKSDVYCNEYSKAVGNIHIYMFGDWGTDWGFSGTEIGDWGENRPQIGDWIHVESCGFYAGVK